MSDNKIDKYAVAHEAIESYTALIERLLVISDKALSVNEHEAAAMALGNAMQANAMRVQLNTAMAEEQLMDEARTKRPTPSDDPRPSDDPLGDFDD